MAREEDDAEVRPAPAGRLALRALALALAALACCAGAALAAGPSASPNVVGGETARDGELPSLAFVAYLIPNGKEEAIVCSGSVVAPRLVLTAAHCIEPPGVRVLDENFRIFIGRANWRDARRLRTYHVDRTWAYPRYDESRGSGDAALLELVEPASVTPARLAARAFWRTGTEVEVAGWGDRSRFQEKPTYVLRHAGLEVVPAAECESQGAGRAGQICAEDAAPHHSTACFGDSGGPLFARRPGDGRRVQVGVVHGGEYCKPAFPSVYTSTVPIFHWVHARIVESRGL